MTVSDSLSLPVSPPAAEGRAPWAQFELLVEQLSDGVTVQDLSGRLVYANEIGARMAGYASPAELLAAPVGDFLNRFEICDAQGWPIALDALPGRRALVEGRANSLLRVRDRQSGVERWTDVLAHAVRDAAGSPLFVVNMFRDVSELLDTQRMLEEQTEELESQIAQAHALSDELERANDDLARALREEALARQEAERALTIAGERAVWLARLQQLTVGLSRAVSFAEAVDVAMSLGRDAFEARRASLWLFDDFRGSLRLVTHHGLSEELAARVSRFTLEGEFAPSEAVRTGDAVLLGTREEVLTRYPSLAGTLDELGGHAIAAMPVRVGGEIIGALDYGYDEVKEFGPDFATALRTFAKELGQAVERTRSRAALEEARRAADVAARAKSGFLATMSHELRTPINAILGFADLLQAGVAKGDEARAAQYVQRIRDNTGHLLELINDVLDWSKVEAGRMTVRTREQLAADIIEDAVSTMRPQSEARSITLTEACAEYTTYVGDPIRVRQILLNLLSNAIKFTEPCGRVSLECTSAEGVTRFTIEDTGAGIAASDLESIFQPFVQAEAVYTRTHGGTGLGLAISRRLARLMGGDITVESEQGRGSTFALTLPAHERRSTPRSPRPVTVAIAM